MRNFFKYCGVSNVRSRRVPPNYDYTIFCRQRAELRFAVKTAEGLIRFGRHPAVAQYTLPLFLADLLKRNQYRYENDKYR